MSDAERVLLYMRRCGGITAGDAAEQFGCENLDAEIAELRRRGYLIECRNGTRYEFTR